MEESQGSSGWMQLFQTSVTLIVTSKAEKGRDVPRLLSLSTPLNETKQNIPLRIFGLTQKPVQTHGPILRLLLWTTLFYKLAASQDHVGQKNGWLQLKGRIGLGMSLVAQGLRVHLPVQRVWVLSLVGELRSHMP